jgi:hypothetical protein
LFNNTNYANVGDATGLRGSTTAGSLYFSLHTADPGEAGTQSTNEANYTSYARVAVARSSAGFTVTTNQVVNAAAIQFPAPTAGTNTLLYWGLGVAASGATALLYKGPLSSAPLGFSICDSVSGNIIIKTHSLVVDDRVSFYAIAGLALPAAITEGTIYYVRTIPSTDTITLSSTLGGGSPVTISTSGQGICFKHTPYVTTVGVQPQFVAGAFRITED